MGISFGEKEGFTGAVGR